MNMLKAALIAAALLAAGPALAQREKPSMGETPLYIGAHYGNGTWSNGCFASPCDGENNTGRILAGWQFTDVLAVEIAYNNLGKASAPGYFVKANAWEVVGVAGWRIADSPFSLYGKAGPYRAAAENNVPLVTTSWSVTFGAGVAFDATRNITFRGEWQSYRSASGDNVSPTSNIDVLSAGILWRFR